MIKNRCFATLDSLNHWYEQVESFVSIITITKEIGSVVEVWYIDYSTE